MTHMPRYGALLTLVLALAALRSAAGDADPAADLIASKLKMTAGLALDVGCGDGKLAIAVARKTKLTIHAIDADPAVVARARQAVDAAGLYGTRITASVEPAGPLNYPDASATLVFCGDPGAPGAGGLTRFDLKEIRRVLSPNGVAVIGGAIDRKELEAALSAAGVAGAEIVEKDGTWAVFTRPAADGVDEWRYRWHDPANTFASNDTLPFGPYRAKWIADFIPGLGSASVVIGDGKMIIASLAYPQRPKITPYLQCLDAYTGVELWSHVGVEALPLNRTPGLYVPREPCSDMALVGGVCYLLGGKICARFDAASGKALGAFDIPAEAKPAADDAWLYMTIDGEVLVGASGPPPKVRVDWNTMFYRGVSRAVFAIDHATGKCLWAQPGGAMVGSMAVAGGTLFYVDTDLTLHGVRLADGKELFARPTGLPAGSEVAMTAVYAGKCWLVYNAPIRDKDGKAITGWHLLSAGMLARQVAALSIADGKKLFDAEFGIGVSNIACARGKVYGAQEHAVGAAAVDAETGKFCWKDEQFGNKCSPIVMTPKMLLYHPGVTSLLNAEDLDARAARPGAVNFGGFRPTCSYPAIPALGMLFVQGDGCACASPLRGNIAMMPGKPAAFGEDATARLVRGEAFGKPIAGGDEENVWHGWRADAARSGRTDPGAPGAAGPMQPAWNVRLPDRPTAVACGGGRVYVGCRDKKLRAIDAATGAVAWQHFAAGRIRQAPWLDGGRVYFSDDAGWATCLRAADGELVWRYRLAPSAERMVGYGDYTSRWPAGSGVIVAGGVAYAPAGLFPGDGVTVTALDAATGEPKWTQPIGPGGRWGRTGGYVPGGTMAIGGTDLFIPSGGGTPWEIPLAGDSHAPRILASYHARGADIMAAGEDVLSASPDLEHVYHAQYAASDPSNRLPVLTDDRVFLLNRPAGRHRYLACWRREACTVKRQRVIQFAVTAEFLKQGPESYLLWQAWEDKPMTAMIQAGSTLISGGPGAIYGTGAADGKELWTAPVEGTVTDLAFHNGRLLAVTDANRIVCLVPSDRSGKE